MIYNKAIDFYINHLLDPHEVKTHKEYPNSIFWVKDGNIIVEIKYSKYFWLRKDIWVDISRMFELDYNGTQSAIKDWLEQHHNLGELTPNASSTFLVFLLEQHYNLGGLTPSSDDQ